MNEEEWLTCGDPLQMLDFLLTGKASSRKLRLFACSWFRGKPRWAGVADIVAIGERHADGAALRGEIEQARSRAGRAGGKQAVWVTVCDDITHAVRPVFSHEFAALESHVGGYVHRLHDIFGNPFRPAEFDPAWRSEVALALATGIHVENAFDRLPVLADALEEAGCDAADILSHCRGEGSHVRGCWAVDLVLDKQ